LSCAAAYAAQLETKIKVGISPFSPFIIMSEEEPIGLSIDLWQALSRETGLDFEFVIYEGVVDKLRNLQEGSIDIAIGGITITEKREEILDFTHPVYHTGLDILIPRVGNHPLQGLLSSLFKGNKFVIFGGLMVLIIIAGHIIWIVERSSKNRTTSFHRKYLPGVFEGMYWALITASTIGYGDKVPQRWIGRVLATIIIIIFLPLFAFFIAQLSSDLTMQSLKANINGPEDLRGRRVAVVGGTTSYEYMRKERAYIDTFPTVEDAYDALLKGTVDAVVYDATNLLFYANNEGKGKVVVVGKIFEPQDYGLAIPQGSPLREKINRAILNLVENDELGRTFAKWLGPAGSP
ncbi:MAG: transporter substrate-binding domain-containing protein, partial [Desulfobacterales bacterium]